MARFPAVTNQSAAAVVAFLVSCGADLGMVPSRCQTPSRPFPAGCHQDAGGLPQQGGQGGFPSLAAALSSSKGSASSCWALPWNGEMCAFFPAALPPHCAHAFSPWEEKGLIDVPGVAQGWDGRRQSLLENACEPHVCSLVPGTWGSGHGGSCAALPSSA